MTLRLALLFHEVARRIGTRDSPGGRRADRRRGPCCPRRPHQDRRPFAAPDLRPRRPHRHHALREARRHRRQPLRPEARQLGRRAAHALSFDHGRFLRAGVGVWGRWRLTRRTEPGGLGRPMGWTRALTLRAVFSVSGWPMTARSPSPKRPGSARSRSCRRGAASRRTRTPSRAKRSPASASPSGAPFIAVFVFSLVMNFLALTIPIYMSQLYDRVLTSYSSEDALHADDHGPRPCCGFSSPSTISAARSSPAWR